MKIVYIDHYDSFSQMIAAHFSSAGAEVVMFKSDSPLQLILDQKADMILLGPGPNGPEHSGNYLDILKSVSETTPLFGICLGFQTILHYFGADIHPLNEIIHGASSEITHDGKTIFENISSPAPFSRYHSLGTQKAPECFEVSASCGNIIMGARHKKLLIEGIQFHPESILSMEGYVGEQLIANVVKHYERTLKQRHGK